VVIASLECHSATRELADPVVIIPPETCFTQITAAGAIRLNEVLDALGLGKDEITPSEEPRFPLRKLGAFKWISGNNLMFQLATIKSPKPSDQHLRFRPKSEEKVQ